MRICLTTTTKVELTTAKDGSYQIEGYGKENYMQFVRIASQLFYKNFSLFVTTSDDECLHRLKGNLSDVSTAMFSYYDDQPAYQVPVPMFLSKLSFITGYDLVSKHPQTKECGSVFDNLTLFPPSAYFWTFFLFITFILFIAFKTISRLNHKKCLKKSNQLINPHNRIKCAFMHISRQVKRTYYCRSEHFRFISLLFVVLCFYLIKFFAILYKTSQIIVEEPFVVDSYEKLISDKDALPSFYDVIAKVSEKFKTAPRDAVKGRIWSKLMNSQVNLDDFIRGGNNTKKGLDLITLVKRQFKLMNEKHCVLFASSITVNLLKTMYYASSPEDELWRIFVFADDSEGEELLGYPLSNLYQDKNYFVSRTRRLFESFIINKFYQRALDASRLGYTFAGTTKKHQYEQNLVCSDDFSIEIHVKVDGIGTKYFYSFFASILAIYLTAALAQVAELFIGKRRAKKKKIRRQPKQPWPVTYRFSVTLNYIYSITNERALKKASNWRVN